MKVPSSKDQLPKMIKNFRDFSFVPCYLLLALYLLPLEGFTQYFTEKTYPKNYFRWPVEAEVGIVANFGELRPNHWHMGLDVRTNQKENIPVVAAADGYIAMIKIEPWGFGRAIYINHPNGLTTLYAHLNDFEPKLEAWIKDLQYKAESWALFTALPPNLFPVKKGDLIAYSGNTGGSQGPHVHFEIRDTKTEKCLNGMMFGLPLPDNTAPDVYRLAVYDRTKSTYDQRPTFYPLKKVNGVYTPAGGKIIAASDKLSFAVTAADRWDGSPNANGIYAGAVIANGKEITRFEIDSISYDETRLMNAHIDHFSRGNGGPWLQHLSALPGYRNGIYKSSAPEGILQLTDSVTKTEIVIADASLNESRISFDVIYFKDKKDAIDKKVSTGFKKLIPGDVNIVDLIDFNFYLPENAIYDTVKFSMSETGKGAARTILLQSGAVPVQTYYPIGFANPFPMADTGRIMMKRSWNGKTDFKKANFHKGFMVARFRDFGYFTLINDSVPPTVVPSGISNGANLSKATRILFRVTDNTEEIDLFEAKLDGKWLRFTNDKGINYIYRFDDKCGPGEHELVVRVRDLSGNETIKRFNFTR